MTSNMGELMMGIVIIIVIIIDYILVYSNSVQFIIVRSSII